MKFIKCKYIIIFVLLNVSLVFAGLCYYYEINHCHKCGAEDSRDQKDFWCSTHNGSSDLLRSYYHPLGDEHTYTKTCNPDCGDDDTCDGPYCEGCGGCTAHGHCHCPLEGQD